MSGIYISGMEMPEEGICKTITIFDDGAVVEGNGSEKLGIAVPVPPHGDLIDKSGVDVVSWIEDPEKDFADGVLFVLDKLDELPVIIPADGEDFEATADKEGE